MNDYYVGHCKVCKQGMLEIVKSRDTGEIFICCDECEAEWKNPEDALYCKNGNRNKYGMIKKVTLEDIKKLNWESYLK